MHLAPDGTATWTDPTGQARTTTPLNALDALVLRHDPAHGHRHPAEPLPAWSALQTHLQLRLEHHPDPHLTHHPTHRRCTTTTALRAGLTRRRARTRLPDTPPF